MEAREAARAHLRSAAEQVEMLPLAIQLTSAVVSALVYVGDAITRQNALAAVLAGQVDDPEALAAIVNGNLGRDDG